MTARDQLAEVLRDAADRAVEAGLPVLTFEGYADAVIAAGWRPPARILTDPAELAGLSDGSVLLDGRGVVRMLTDGAWVAQSVGDAVLPSALALPARILHSADRPTADRPTADRPTAGADQPAATGRAATARFQAL